MKASAFSLLAAPLGIQVGVVLRHGQVVAVVVGADGGVGALHLAEDLIHGIALEDGLLLDEGVHRLGDLVRVGGVVGVAQALEGDADGVPGVVDHQDIVAVFLIPQQIPAAGVRLVHHGGVVDDTHQAPHIGDRVQVLRVVLGILQLRIHVGEVGNVVEVQGLQLVLIDEAGDHVVGGDDHVVVGAVAVQHGIHGLVALEGLVVDLDAGLFLKVLQDGHVDVLAPVVDVYLTGRAAASAAAQAGRRHSGAQGQCHKFFQFSLVLLSDTKYIFSKPAGACPGGAGTGKGDQGRRSARRSARMAAWVRRSCRLCRTLMRIISAMTTTNMRVDRALISGLMRRRTME